MDAPSEDLAEGQVHTYPESDKETCIRGCEGLVTHDVVAISARDMSVVAVIIDNPP